MKTSSAVVVAMSGLVLSLAVAPAAPAAPPARDESATTLYRDDYGIPHIYAPKLEEAAYAMG
jgi:acyl-homoserine lactone acylase PvdQ